MDEGIEERYPFLVQYKPDERQLSSQDKVALNKWMRSGNEHYEVPAPIDRPQPLTSDLQPAGEREDWWKRSVGPPSCIGQAAQTPTSQPGSDLSHTRENEWERRPDGRDPTADRAPPSTPDAQPTPVREEPKEKRRNMDNSMDDEQREKIVRTLIVEAPEMLRVDSDGKQIAPSWKAYLSPVPTFCMICGEPASGFHYGVSACEGCKGFFRRCQQTGRSLKCQKPVPWSCPIEDRRSRTQCAACRLKKCIDMGMKRKETTRKYQRKALISSSSLTTQINNNEVDENWPPLDAYSTTSESRDGSRPPGSITLDLDGFLIVTPEKKPISGDLPYPSRSPNPSAPHAAPLDIHLVSIPNPNPVEIQLMARLQYAFESTNCWLPEIDSSLPKNSISDVVHDRFTIWNWFTQELTGVLERVMDFAKSIQPFVQLDERNQIRLLRGSVFEMALISMSRGYFDEKNEIILNDYSYPLPLEVVAEEHGDNQEIRFIDNVFDCLKDIRMRNMNAAQMSLLSAIILFEGTGIVQTLLRNILSTYLFSSEEYARINEICQHLKWLAVDHRRVLLQFCAYFPEFPLPQMYLEMFAMGNDEEPAAVVPVQIDVVRELSFHQEENRT